MTVLLYCPLFPGLRPGADDVLVLRKELIHAQTLMDQLSLVREKEKGKVEEECVSLEEKSKQ